MQHHPNETAAVAATLGLALSGADPAPGPRAPGQHTQAVCGHWQLASTCLTGLRHLAQNRSCEDSAGHRPQPAGGITVAMGDGVSSGAHPLAASASAVDYCLSTPLHNVHLGALDQNVRHAVALHSERPGATTLAAAWLDAEGQGQLLHVGDCRAYLWRPAEATLHLLTRDHTFTTLGELPPRHVPADNPARMLGVGHIDMSTAPHRRPVQLAPGDVLMLSTDGLHASLPHRALTLAFARFQASMQRPGLGATPRLARLTRCLARAACQHGSDDDISLLLLRHATTLDQLRTPHLL